MNEHRIQNIADDAMALFNEEMGTSFSEDNVILRCFVPETGLAVYQSVCAEYFPDWHDRSTDSDGYFETFLGYAIYSAKVDGILIRSDVESSDDELLCVILHELAHIFCSHNEIPGGQFFSRYCDTGTDDKFADGTINAGYAIWREFIADLVMANVNPYFQSHSLRESKSAFKHLLTDLVPENPSAKLCASLILSHVMSSREVGTADSWESAEIAIKKTKLFSMGSFYEIFRLVFENLHDREYWEISPDFIMSLGDQYLCLLTAITIKSIGLPEA